MRLRAFVWAILEYAPQTKEPFPFLEKALCTIVLFFAPKPANYLFVLLCKPVDEIQYLLRAHRGSDTSVGYVLRDKVQAAVPLCVVGHIGVSG